MTDEDDIRSWPVGKVAARAREIRAELLETLGPQAAVAQEASAAVPPRLIPISSFDLLEPDSEAKALWIRECLHTGELVAYGRPTRRDQLSAVPAADWPNLALTWDTAGAEHMVSMGGRRGTAWWDLQVPEGGLQGTRPPAHAGTMLTLVLQDARALAQRWRERRLIPDDYIWPHREFWKANPRLRPDQAETHTAVETAVRSGALPTVMRLDEGWRYLPPSAWNASQDRADLSEGRTNAHESVGLLRLGEWHLVFLLLRDLIEWCNITWGREDAGSGISQDADDAPSHGEATAPATNKRRGKISGDGKGGAPRRYDWDKLGAAFGAWLHDEPGRDRLTPTEHLAALHTLCDLLGSPQPERQTAQPYLAPWLAAYRVFDAGN